jgi:O-antigen/teichoic acid export membrane protein
MRNKSSESIIRAGIVILIGMGVFNAANFLYQFLCARLLGPEEYSIIASVFSLFYIVTVGSSAIQNTAAKFVSNARAKHENGKIYSFFRRGFMKILKYSFLLAIAYLILSPFIASFLKISIVPVLISSISIVLFALIPFNRGIMQGLQEFNALGMNMALEGVIRLTLAVILIILGFKSNGAIAAVLIATAIALVITFPALKLKKTKAKFDLGKKEVYKFAALSFAAFFCVTALYNVDIILVKHFFASEIAGNYAVLSLLGKIIFFAMTAVSLVMFSKISESDSEEKSRRIFKKSMLFASIMGIIILGAYFLFPSQLLGIIFGESYLSVSSLVGMFGVFTYFTSLSYIAILNKLALGKKKFVLIVIAALILEIILICLFHQSLAGVIWVLDGISILLFLILLK